MYTKRVVNTCGEKYCSCKLMVRSLRKKIRQLSIASLKAIHILKQHTHACFGSHPYNVLLSLPLPLSSLNLTHSAHWIIFNPYHLKQRCMPKQPYGHKPPPLSTHTVTPDHMCKAGCIQYCTSPKQLVCAPRVPSHVCVEAAHFLRWLREEGIQYS